jgi:hypothetical protein
LKRYLSSPFFFIALLAFFLPFFAVTCAGGGGIPGLGGGGDSALTEVSGFELVTGQAEDTVAEDLKDFGSGLESGLGDLPIPGPSPSVGAIPDVPTAGATPDLGTPQIWAIAAAVVALLGIFLSILAGRAGGALALILGAVGSVVLFLLAGAFKDAFFEGADAKQAESVISVESKLGFWLALGGFLIAAVTGLVRVMMPDRPAGAVAGPGGFEDGTAPPGAPPTAPPPPEAPPPAAPPTGTPPA